MLSTFHRQSDLQSGGIKIHSHINLHIFDHLGNARRFVSYPPVVISPFGFSLEIVPTVMFSGSRDDSWYLAGVVAYRAT
jgi:hypothetical protein